MNIYDKQEPVPFERLLNFFSSESIKKHALVPLSMTPG